MGTILAYGPCSKVVYTICQAPRKLNVKGRKTQKMSISPECCEILHITHRWLHSTRPGNVDIKANSWAHTHLQKHPQERNG